MTRIASSARICLIFGCLIFSSMFCSEFFVADLLGSEAVMIDDGGQEEGRREEPSNCTLHLTTDKSSYELGEPILLTVFMTNLSDEHIPICVVDGFWHVPTLNDISVRALDTAGPKIEAFADLGFASEEFEGRNRPAKRVIDRRGIIPLGRFGLMRCGGILAGRRMARGVWQGSA